MGSNIEGPVVDAGDGPRRLDRRTMIKGAAIAGAAAWTAPIIIDSLVSPAAAASVPGRCYGFTVSSTGASSCGAESGSTAAAPTGCSPTGWGSFAADATLLGQVNETTCGQTALTAVLTHSSTCRFTAGSSYNTANAICSSTTPTITNTSTTSTLAFSGLFNATRTYYLVICCT